MTAKEQCEKYNWTVGTVLKNGSCTFRISGIGEQCVLLIDEEGYEITRNSLDNYYKLRTCHYHFDCEIADKVIKGEVDHRGS